MNRILAAIFGVCATTLATSFPPSPESISSDVQILLHNDLYGNESNRQDAVIVVEPARTYRQAKKACAALSEYLWTPPFDIKRADFLDYLFYQTKHDGGPRHRRETSLRPREQRYYVAGSGSYGACKSIDPSSGKVQSANCNAKLPALCTQTAPLSDVNNTDTSPRRQTQVSSGRAVYTGWRDKLSFRFPVSNTDRSHSASRTPLLQSLLATSMLSTLARGALREVAGRGLCKELKTASSSTSTRLSCPALTRTKAGYDRSCFGSTEVLSWVALVRIRRSTVVI
jgi:hypothetical protein